MKVLKRVLYSLVLIFSLQMVMPTASYAQCPMCRISAESNLKAGGTAGKGLNKGILYLFFTPYLVIGGLAFVWWKNRKNLDDLPDGTSVEVEN